MLHLTYCDHYKTGRCHITLSLTVLLALEETPPQGGSESTAEALETLEVFHTVTFQFGDLQWQVACYSLYSFNNTSIFFFYFLYYTV